MKGTGTMAQTLAEVTPILTSTVERWQRLAAAPAALLSRVPAPGEWSALDCLAHLIDAEQLVFPPRMQAFLQGADLAPFDPHAQEPRTGEAPAALVAEFARLRAAALATLDQLTEDDLARTVTHPELGPVTLGQLLYTWAAHDLNHTIQAERALIQPFMDGCGPWRVFFQDHEPAKLQQD
jgi:uncharacterized protein YqcC (DUF446 family)